MFGLKIIMKSEYNALKNAIEYANKRIGELAEKNYALKAKYDKLAVEYTRITDRDERGRFVRNEDKENTGHDLP